MNALVKNLLLGVVAGVAAGAVAHVLEQQSEENQNLPDGEQKPLLPSSLTAFLQKIAPVCALIARDYLTGDDEAASADGADEPAATTAPIDPNAPQHPAGPGFAPTPE